MVFLPIIFYICNSKVYTNLVLSYISIFFLQLPAKATQTDQSEFEPVFMSEADPDYRTLQEQYCRIKSDYRNKITEVSTLRNGLITLKQESDKQFQLLNETETMLQDLLESNKCLETEKQKVSKTPPLHCHSLDNNSFSFFRSLTRTHIYCVESTVKYLCFPRVLLQHFGRSTFMISICLGGKSFGLNGSIFVLSGGLNSMFIIVFSYPHLWRWLTHSADSILLIEVLYIKSISWM